MSMSSGARGTAGQQQDRRNAADRSNAMGGGSGARGTMGQQQDRRNTANAHSRGNIAPGVGMGSATDSRARNSRYNQNLIASGPMTTHNMVELGKMLPGPGMAIRAGLGIAGSSLGPQFEGTTPRSATGYSYDGPNRFGTGANAAFRPNMPTMNPNKARAQALAPSNPMVAPDWWRMPF